VELCDCACLVCLQILQVETADDVIFTPDVLRHQVYLSHTSSCYSLNTLGVPVTHKQLL